MEVVIHHPHDEDSQDDILDLGESGMEAVTDFEDLGFEIVTEDKSTNCPSLNGSLRKSPKKKEVQKQESIPEADVKETAVENKSQEKGKRWSKLMKYTLPSKNPEPKANKKNKERKSLRDKMKDNDIVAFLTERRAVSESRFRVLDKIGEPSKRLVKTKSEQSLDEAWNTGITSGTIKSLKQKFEHDEEINFELQSPVIVKDATSSTGDLGKVDKKEADVVDNNESLQSTGSSNAKINETHQDSGNDDKKKDKKGKKKEKKKCDVCSSDKEHREHRREKRRLKKEKQERKREKEASHLQESKDSQSKIRPNNVGPCLPAAVTVAALNEAKSRINGDNFFQKLLMKDEFSKQGNVERLSRPLRKEKKYVFQPSEPAMGKYLKGKKAVSESKFKQFEEFEKFVERSLLPRGIIKCEEFNEKKSMFEGARPVSSMGQASSRQVSPGRPMSSMGQLLDRPVSSMSNRSMSGDRRCFSLPRPGSSMSQGRPGSSLSQVSNSSFIIDQQEYKNYVYEMINSTPKNPRFNQLTQYFSTLERVTKLESESGSMDVHKLKSDDIVDFETWRQLRKQEKAKEELNELLFDLRKAQKDREFHFRPKEVDSVRWSGDSRLRARDKSVENLKNLFAQKACEDDFLKRRNTSTNKDVYKLYWRPKSVTDLSKESEQPSADHSQTLDRSKLGPESKFTTYPKSRNVASPYRDTSYNFLTQQRSRSSLSMDQVSAIKHQLNEILSAKNSAASSVASSRSPSRADNFSVEVKCKADSHPLQSLGLFVKPIPDVVRRSVAEAERNEVKRPAPRSRSEEEEERKRLSKTINEELLRKVNIQPDGRKKKIDFDIQNIKQTPRTCHSLERDKSGVRKNPGEDDDFILVLSDGEQKNDEVEETLDKWASAGESEDETRINEIRRRMKGRLSGLQSSQSSDSISSGTSIHTVIFKDGINRCNYDKSILPTNEESGLTKTISEITTEFEEKHLKGTPFSKDALTSLPSDEIPTNLVKEIRKSFENMSLPEPPTEEELLQANLATLPDTPQRSSSFRRTKQRQSSGSRNSLDKDSPQSKSVCSISDKCNDEGYATFPNSPRKPPRPQGYLEKTYVPEKSISNVDLTDSENNGLEETFGRMHEKVHSIGNSHDLGDYGFIGHKSLPYVPQPSYMVNPNKYNRAYLTLSKNGDVRDKLNKFESKLDGNPLRSMPSVDRDFIRNRATAMNKVVIKPQEIPDVNCMKQKLESYEKDKDLFDYCSGLLTKDKLKHFCKKVGHSKIISKMASLQRSANVEDDAGFRKLNIKASAETDYISKYRSGDVEQKKIAFENAVTPCNPSPNSSSPYFSWSNR